MCIRDRSGTDLVLDPMYAKPHTYRRHFLTFRLPGPRTIPKRAVHWCMDRIGRISEPRFQLYRMERTGPDLWWFSMPRRGQEEPPDWFVKASQWMTMRRDVVEGVLAVSYTHLDVYKRQDPFGVLGANALTRAVSARVLSTADRVRRPPLREVGRMAAPLWPEATDRLVTVAVPNFHYGAYLPDAVASAVAQRGVAVEVVIVDDCSTDDSFAVAQSLAARYDNVVALQNDVNQGHGRTFNRAWRAGRGEFVVRLDADDILAPDALARSVALFERFDDVGLVLSLIHI